jgi:hypothetical protein
MLSNITTAAPEVKFLNPIYRIAFLLAAATPDKSSSIKCQFPAVNAPVFTVLSVYAASPIPNVNPLVLSVAE